MDSEIVISGIAGRFPQSESLDEFWKNLIGGVDMITDNPRWNTEAYDLPKRIGSLCNLDRFDADYFGLHGKQADVTDPKLRIALELTQEALLDGGMNPVTLRGSSTGVFAGASLEEAGGIWQRSSEDPSGYITLGCGSCMLANRVSYVFDLRGPSYSMDAACAAGAMALQNAILGIRFGLCEGGIVSGISLCLDPLTSNSFHKLGMLGAEGKCRVFDASALGYVRAEAGVVLSLCKREVAKRSYATIMGVRCNSDGYKSEGLTFPSGASQQQLIREVYAECGVSPLDVGYIEAHGTGTKAGDPVELNALAAVFCDGRAGGPLLVGSVKSNMGHSEMASGLCGISKILLANRFGILPANLHFESPNPDVPALLDGRLKVASENTVFRERYAGINCFGYGGSNVHILLKLSPKSDVPDWSPSIPILVPVSGRTPEAVEYLLLELSSYGRNRNAIALFHEIFKVDIPRYRVRGYALLGTPNPENCVQEEPSPFMPQLWFVFTGFGSHWTGMSRDLMKFPAFEQSILESAEALGQNGFDLLQVLSSESPQALEDFKNCMVSTTVMQVALVDLLGSLGVTPEGILGHSNGECAASYADGSCTHNQAVLVSLARARGFTESNLPLGTVAAVGLTWEEATRRCPAGVVFPAIHNSKTNVTIAGPPEPVRQLVAQLKSEGILASEVKSAAYGFHSPYVKGSETLMRELLGKVLPEPKARSSKWLSSSIPAESWDSELARSASADYFVNNGLSRVYFYQTLLHLPGETIVLEVGPHCFMQSILKQTLPPTTEVLGLMSKRAEDNASFFLNSMGKLHLYGGSIDVSRLYDPPVEFPVGPETPMISPWIKWDHSQTWDVPNVANEISKGGGSKYTIDLAKESDSFYQGHTIDGRVIFPATGYVLCVWKAFAQSKGIKFDLLPVIFEDLRFERVTLLNNQKPTELVVNILSDAGQFEVTEGDAAVVRGRIRTVPEASIPDEMFDSPQIQVDQIRPFRTKNDCYKELRLRGYQYSGHFQGIRTVSMNGAQAQLDWNDNWVSFLDTLLQASTISKTHRGLYVPVRIQKLTIDPLTFRRYLLSSAADASVVVPLVISKTLSTCKCSGIELRRMQMGLTAWMVNREVPTITQHLFLPYFDNDEDELLSFQAALDLSIGIVMDNSLGKKFILAEHFSQPEWQSISTSVSSHCVIRFEGPECRLVLTTELLSDPAHSNAPTNSKLMSMTDLTNQPELCNLLYLDDVGAVQGLSEIISPRGFLLIKDTVSEEIPAFTRVAHKRTQNSCSLTLYKRDSNPALNASIPIHVTHKDFSWVDSLQGKLASKTPDERIILVSKGTSSGLTGLVKSLIREPGGEKVRGFSIESGDLKLNFEEEPLLASQLKQDLAFNIYQRGVWGCYSNVVVPMEELEEPLPSSCAYANILTTGDLSSLAWVESPLRLESSGAQDLCTVSHAALNFKDIMLATGKLSRDALPGELAFEDCILGLEYSGLCSSSGRRLMGMRSSKCLATKILVDPRLSWEIPESWSFAEAATVPAVYATVLYGLVVRARLRAGESILIHSGSGGVGQAAISVALSMGCTVYTSVGTMEKREFLLERFPQLQGRHITDSRNAKVFEEHILEETGGSGVDLVLNSLAKDKFHASIRCLGVGGRFVEIGKVDAFENTAVGMAILLMNVSILGVALDALMAGQSEDLIKTAALVQEGINSGVVQPLPFTCFGQDELEQAFRYMTTGKHMGKVLIQMAPDAGGVPSLPRTYFYPHKSYVLIGGLGGMGLEIAGWMIGRECRNLVLNSRSGVRNSYQEYRIKCFRGQGANVVVDLSDASQPEGAISLLESAKALGPIGGLFNVAMDLHDGLFENQSPARFQAASKAKTFVTIELDQASRVLAPELDHFVVFSSIVAARGNPGQTNYGFANSVMERICETRKREGLPGLAIQWGLIDNAETSLDDPKAVERRISAVGMTSQKTSSWLPTVDLFLRQETRSVVSSFVAAQSSDSSLEDTSTASSSLVSGLARILGIKDVSKINVDSSLYDLGMDSVMAIEINSFLDARVGDTSSIADTPGQLTFAQLMAIDNEWVPGGDEKK